jgi:hypothetical protein
MPSALPLVLAALIFTGLAASVWRLSLALPSRRQGRQSGTDATHLRLDAIRQLAWTVLLLAHFVLIQLLSESREAPHPLAVAGSVAGGLCLIAAVVTLGSTIAAEKSLS